MMCVDAAIRYGRRHILGFVCLCCLIGLHSLINSLLFSFLSLLIFISLCVSVYFLSMSLFRCVVLAFSIAVFAVILISVCVAVFVAVAVFICLSRSLSLMYHSTYLSAGYSTPFYMQVKTDADEYSRSIDLGNRGFELQYTQLPCSGPYLFNGDQKFSG